jgi:hypothetical protein
VTTWNVRRSSRKFDSERSAAPVNFDNLFAIPKHHADSHPRKNAVLMSFVWRKAAEEDTVAKLAKQNSNNKAAETAASK